MGFGQVATTRKLGRCRFKGKYCSLYYLQRENQQCVEQNRKLSGELLGPTEQPQICSGKVLPTPLG